ncbi:MAG: hypothetical protein G3M78_06625 [Candidatus Nitrohelix vancouverensis]|uniref:Uncharacterized protein n=1 Tax=Candidatus Nitrohelix vancouverensis TaxID=2705534 RepID=A0A7T0C204_9BACT|nr:MAG: hypothetical protein G3M78_06625 [Candidatus Nitrohelix vancouverensis]
MTASSAMAQSKGNQENYDVSPRFFSDVADAKTKSVYWMYVQCDYWLGCYTRCEGTLKECVQTADRVDWKIESVYYNNRETGNLVEGVRWQQYLSSPPESE